MGIFMPAPHETLSDLIKQTLTAFSINADGNDKPRVLVSACLLGERVRYDGDDRREPLVADALSRWLDYRPMCPEVGIGMPVPRPPIQVVSIAGIQHARAVAHPHEDASDALTRYAMQLPADIDGILLKARSPSCGVGSTPLHDENGKDTGRLTDGLVAARLAERFPALARSDEQALADTGQSLAFVTHCWLYRQWRQGHTMDSDLVAWQHHCLQIGTAPFLYLAERLQHWRGRP